jgi:hypothetical protein
MDVTGRVNKFRVSDFLSERASGLPHPGGTLYEHLLRVERRLAEWGVAPEVQVAGRYHAAYGTDGFAPVLLDLADRGVLVELIGDRAEALVYLYASCDRVASYPRLRAGRRPAFRDRFAGADLDPGEAELSAFLDITAANELDVFEHNEELATQYGPGMYRLLESVRARLSDAAWDSWQTWRSRQSWQNTDPPSATPPDGRSHRRHVPHPSPRDPWQPQEAPTA